MDTDETPLFRRLFGLNIIQKGRVLSRERNQRERTTKERVLKPKPRGRAALVARQKKARQGPAQPKPENND